MVVTATAALMWRCVGRIAYLVASNEYNETRNVGNCSGKFLAHAFVLAFNMSDVSVQKTEFL